MRLDLAERPIEEATRCLDLGARGIKLHPRAQKFLLDDERLAPVFELAAERHVPILIHGGRGLPPIADALARLMDRYEGTLIIAHAGIADLAALAHHFSGRPGVYFDTSVWSPLDLLDLYRLVSPEQVLFASDYPYGGAGVAASRAPHRAALRARRRAAARDARRAAPAGSWTARRAAADAAARPRTSRSRSPSRASTSTSRWRRRCSGRARRTRSACSAWRSTPATSARTATARTPSASASCCSPPATCGASCPRPRASGRACARADRLPAAAPREHRHGHLGCVAPSASTATPHEVDVPVGRTLAETLREDLGLTGTKIACGEGHCGACTVQVDGVPVLSLHHARAHGRRRDVTTIEGLRDHPLVEAFVRADALQCGFCTPGQIVSAAALVAGPEPAREEIRHAHGRQPLPLRRLPADRGGDRHLARLIRTEKEVEGRYETVWTVVEEDALEQWPAGPLSVVGRRRAAHRRLQGRAARRATPPTCSSRGCCTRALLRSPHARARVASLDLAPPLALPGVRDARRARRRRRRRRAAGYHGAPVAAVAADTLAQARAASSRSPSSGRRSSRCSTPRRRSRAAR